MCLGVVILKRKICIIMGLAVHVTKLHCNHQKSSFNPGTVVSEVTMSAKQNEKTTGKSQISKA